MYYFKPYSQNLTSFAVQLMSWGMGEAMAKHIPKKNITVFGKSFSLNPGPWNAKEHALIVVAYWGSCYAAYGTSSSYVCVKSVVVRDVGNLTMSYPPRFGSFVCTGIVLRPQDQPRMGHLLLVDFADDRILLHRDIQRHLGPPAQAILPWW